MPSTSRANKLGSEKSTPFFVLARQRKTFPWHAVKATLTFWSQTRPLASNGRQFGHSNWLDDNGGQQHRGEWCKDAHTIG
jgi:hypothetical protein